MLLSYPSHSPIGHAFHHHHHHNHHTSIRTPPRVSSPKLASLSLAESSTKPPPSPLGSSLLIMDQQGEMHDPSYLSTLRTLHAEIGARATPQGRRRMSSGAGLHISSTPSSSGLGLSGRDVDRFQQNSFSSEDDSDTDDDDDEDFTGGNSYDSTLLDSVKADRSQSFSSPRSSQLPTPPRSPAFFTTHDDESSSLKEKQQRRASWASRRREHSSKSARSNSQQDAEWVKSDNWGFTGLVDLEREQRVARASMDEQGRRDSLYETRDVAATEPSSPHSKSAWSLLGKDIISCSSTSAASQSQRKPANIRASHSGGTSGFWSLSHSKGTSSAMRRQASLSSLNHTPSINQLSTVISGQPMQHDSSSDRCSSISRSTLPEGRKVCQLEAQLLEQQRDATFLVGPSRYKQSKEALKKKKIELGDMASGMRSGASKARKRLEATLKG